MQNFNCFFYLIYFYNSRSLCLVALQSVNLYSLKFPFLSVSDWGGPQKRSLYEIFINWSNSHFVLTYVVYLQAYLIGTRQQSHLKLLPFLLKTPFSSLTPESDVFNYVRKDSGFCRTSVPSRSEATRANFGFILSSSTIALLLHYSLSWISFTFPSWLPALWTLSSHSRCKYNSFTETV